MVHIMTKSFLKLWNNFTFCFQIISNNGNQTNGNETLRRKRRDSSLTDTRPPILVSHLQHIKKFFSIEFQSKQTINPNFLLLFNRIVWMVTVWQWVVIILSTFPSMVFEDWNFLWQSIWTLSKRFVSYPLNFLMHVYFIR